MGVLIRLFLLSISLIVLLVSCGDHEGLKPREEPRSPAQTLFENGMKLLGKKHFIESRRTFQTLITTYPDSEYTPASFLSIADSYYEEGGKENLLQAKIQYKDFFIFYPDHERAEYAQLRLAAVYYRLAEAYDWDPMYTRKAEIELGKFLENSPDSELVPKAEELLREVREKLSKCPSPQEETHAN